MPPEPPPPPSWICSQLGAREHYAIPRALHSAKSLGEFHTDLWSSGVWQACRALGSAGRDLAGRFHPELAQARVRSYPFQGIAGALRIRRSSPAQLGESVLTQSLWLDHAIARELKPHQGPAVFFSYTGTFLESARRIRDRAGFTILGQVDPAATEEEIVARERRRWPGWEKEEAAIPEAWSARRRAEWEEADLILVNSAWCRQALLEQGVPAAKLRILPLAYEPPSAVSPAPIASGGAKLRVLWLGQVILRKGIPYLLEAARLLQDAPVEFRVAGSIGLSAEAIASAPANVRFTGPVSRSQVGDVYREANLFVLPTLSDGFAITQLEAMAHGLPVIATPCCGEVVVPGRNGQIVPPADAEALAAAIAALASDRDALRHLAQGARETTAHFGMNRLRDGLLSLPPS